MNLESNQSIHLSKIEGNACRLYLEWIRLPEIEKIDLVLQQIKESLSKLDSNVYSFIEKILFLRLILEHAPIKIADPIVELFPLLWQSIRASLVHEAPEGYSSDSSIDWRVLKEYSLLVCTMLHKSKLLDRHLLQLATSYKELLLEIKHKGALSSAYDTFLEILKKIAQQQELCKLPSEWLADSLCCLDDVSPVLSYTRRSGGLPFLCLALVICTAEWMKNKQILSTTIASLVSTMSNGNSESRIHAINILRVLFKDSSIGVEILNFTETVLCACINGFTSQEWPVRNGCLMLFSALVLRIFGCIKEASTQTVNQLSFDEFYRKFHRGLIPKMLQELAICTENVHCETNLHPSLFPILAMLSRLSIGNSIVDCECRRQFATFLIRCFSSPVLKIREMAALCLPRLIDADSVDRLLHRLFEHRPHSNNWLHSCLMLAIELKKLNILVASHLSIIQKALSTVNDLLPYHAFLIQNELNISMELQIKNSLIGHNLSILCKPLQSHVNCDLFCKHGDISQVKSSELVRIFNARCNQLCMSKCLDELCRRNEFVACSIDNFDGEINLCDFLFKTQSTALICSVIRYIHNFFNQFSIESIISVFSFYSQPDVAQEIRLQICNSLNFIHVDRQNFNFAQAISNQSSRNIDGIAAKIGVLFLILLQDDDTLIRQTAAAIFNKCFYPDSMRKYCESYCLETILKLLFGSPELHRHYVEELAKLDKRIEANKDIFPFEIESPNIHREFHVELSALSTISKPSQRATLLELIRICKP